MAANVYSPAALCRLDRALVDAVAEDRGLAPVIAWACFAILAGAGLYGGVFGLWRSPLQGLFGALKLPALILTVTAASGLVNGMLAQILGAGLSHRQVWTCILISLAVSSILLGALSPVMLFFTCQATPADLPGALDAYRVLLPAHTAMVGLCGIAGNIRVYRLLRALPRCAPLAGRVLLSWIAVSGFVGCELSWLFSPFLSRPDLPVSFLNPLAFQSNFFEYLWHTALGHL
jgi:hypothetical protein